MLDRITSKIIGQQVVDPHGPRIPRPTTFSIRKPLTTAKSQKYNEMIGVLGHDSALLRLNWAGDNLGEQHKVRKSKFKNFFNGHHLKFS